MTAPPSGGRIMAMRRLRIKPFIGISLLLGVLLVSAVLTPGRQKRVLVVEELETGKIYAEIPVKTGEEVSFQWEHSFEHIPWYEYYEIQKDGSFILHTIAVAGFGAGIPAEMDCKYRYEDGLVYMDEIESVFPQFNWINSQTALKNIKVNGELLIQGSDMPHHVKMVLRIRNGFEK